MFCDKIKPKVRVMLKQFDTYVDSHVDMALKVTAAIKAALDSPLAGILVAVIPGDLDNTLRTQLSAALQKALEALAIVNDCKQYTALDDKLQCFASEIKQRDPQLQDAILQKLASLMAGELDGQRLKQNLYDLFTQVKYSAGK